MSNTTMVLHHSDKGTGMDLFSTMMAIMMQKMTQKPILWDMRPHREYCYFTPTELRELIEQDKRDEAAS